MNDQDRSDFLVDWMLKDLGTEAPELTEDEASAKSEKTARMFIRAGIIGFFAFVVIYAITAYLLTGQESVFDLPPDLESMAQLGDFLGGGLGAAAAFSGALFFLGAFLLQRSELAVQRNEVARMGKMYLTQVIMQRDANREARSYAQHTRLIELARYGDHLVATQETIAQRLIERIKGNKAMRTSTLRKLMGQSHWSAPDTDEVYRETGLDRTGEDSELLTMVGSLATRIRYVDDDINRIIANSGMSKEEKRRARFSYGYHR